MECFRDYIGLEGCTTTTPDSGLFINQLPGIELELFDKLADPQQLNFTGVYNDIQTRAIRRFKTDINSEFKKRYQLKSITQSIDIGKTVGATTTASAADYRGFTLELDRQGGTSAFSNLQSIRIQELNLFFTSTNATTIKVFDMDLGTELHSQAVAAPASTGFTNIKIFKTFTARRLFVAYDATLLNGQLLDITLLQNAILSGQGGCYLSYSCGGNRNAEVRAGSATIASTITESDITIGTDTFGLSGVFSVICDWETFVCNNRDAFANAFWYLLGAETMSERLNSNRLNEFTTFDRNTAGELRKFFEIKYKGGKIDDILEEGELPLVLDGIDVNLSDYCIICNDEIRFEETPIY